MIRVALVVSTSGLRQVTTSWPAIHASAWSGNLSADEHGGPGGAPREAVQGRGER